MIRFIRSAAVLIPAFAILASAQPAVHVDSDLPKSPRPLNQQTEHALVRDYIQSWQALQAAFQQNRADLLDEDFVGGARDNLSASIKKQSALGMRTQYQGLSHNLQIVLYSPDGLSIELIDTVTYNVKVFDRNRLVATRKENARYLVVMTPSQLRWRVRVFQTTQA
jgi:hypothetical protein